VLTMPTYAKRHPGTFWVERVSEESVKIDGTDVLLCYDGFLKVTGLSLTINERAWIGVARIDTWKEGRNPQPWQE